jgi:thiol:disulfide interchange protein DsbA
MWATKAHSQAQSSATVPYREIPRVNEDAKIVLIFIDFACPYCASMHDRLARWGASLPRDWRVAFVPVTVQSVESVMAARAYYAAAAADPGKFIQFVGAAYKHVGGDHRRMGQPQIWRAVAAEAKIKGFDEAFKRVDQKQVADANAQLRLYGINKTPSIAIDGRFVITPDNANGNVDTFFQLANGLVSKAMTEAR